MNYPQKIIRSGASGLAVEAIQRQLIAGGWGNLDLDGIFGPATRLAVKRFQAASLDAGGRSLAVDGEVGLLTWNALFSIKSKLITGGTNTLYSEVVRVASAEIGVSEIGTSNRGTRVDQYMAGTGLNSAGGYPWCMAFVYWCFSQAANKLQIPNPAVRTAGVLDAWQRARASQKISAISAGRNTTLIVPGQAFVMDFGGNQGHSGIVTSVREGVIWTVEGNIHAGGSREGTGVFSRKRTVSSINRGFLAY